MLEPYALAAPARQSGPADQRQDEGCRQSNAGGNEGCAKMHDGFLLKIGVAERG